MNIFHAILLGIIQGLTEFLPISSTAHLTLTGKLLGLIDTNHPETWTAFLAVIQLGTLAAVLMYFRKDIVAMTMALWNDVVRGARHAGQGGLSRDSLLALYVCVGTIPVVIIGLLLKDVIEGMFTKSTVVIATSLIVLALILWRAEKAAKHLRTIEQVTLRDALVVGLAQAVALIPGSSRSGTTITAALFLGFSREAAARFSFLLSIPAVFASGIYQLLKIHPGVFGLGILNLVIATLVSWAAGYAAIAWLLRYLTRHTTMAFVWYRIGLGVFLAALIAAGLLQA